MSSNDRENPKLAKHRNDRESATKKSESKRMADREIQRLQNAFQRVLEDTCTPREQAAINNESEWFSSGTSYKQYRYPLGKWLDNLALRASAEIEDVVIVIEPHTTYARIVRVPRYSAREIIRKAYRQNDKRVFCTSIKWETREIRESKDEFIEERRYDNINRGADEINKDD